MNINNKTAKFTPSKTYKTQANLVTGIKPMIDDMQAWPAEYDRDMSNTDHPTVEYYISVTPENRFFPIFIVRGYHTMVAHHIIEKGFCVDFI